MTLPRSSIVVPIAESSQVGEARRIANSLAAAAGFEDTASGKLALAVTELATNLVRHAGPGEIILNMAVRSSEPGASVGIDVLALDKGRGMADVDRCLQDGYSTAGSSGTGLGAVKRAAAQFDIFAPPGKGVAIFCRFHSGLFIQPPRPVREMGAVNIAFPGEPVCGDAWAAHVEAGRVLVTLADGLGHGMLAAEAAVEAVHVFRENLSRKPSDLIHLMHASMRRSRGAAVAVAEVVTGVAENRPEGSVQFAGVGNIVCTILDAQGRTRSLASHNGIVGHELKRVQEFTSPWNADSVLVMHSDGLQTRWLPEAYPGLWSRHPVLIAGVLYRDFVRGHDDITVFALRRWRQTL